MENMMRPWIYQVERRVKGQDVVIRDADGKYRATVADEATAEWIIRAVNNYREQGYE